MPLSLGKAEPEQRTACVRRVPETVHDRVDETGTWQSRGNGGGNPQRCGRGAASTAIDLGSTWLPQVRSVYGDRLATWEAWEAVSNAAQ